MIASLIWLALGCFFGQNTPPQADVKLPKSTTSGAIVSGIVSITFEGGLHAYQNPPTKEYSIPVSLSVVGSGFKIKPKYPKGSMMSLGGEKEPAAVYGGTIAIPFELTLPKKLGKQKINLRIHYQQCSETQCFVPDDIDLSGWIEVKAKRKKPIKR